MVKFQLTGHTNKTVYVFEDKITIQQEKKGWLNPAASEKTFPITAVSSVQIMKPNRSFFDMHAGYVQFSVIGDRQSLEVGYAGSASIPAGDENTVTFIDVDLYATAEKIKQYIEQYNINQQKGNNSTISAADEILKLKQLLDQGILTQEEFDLKKKQLLNL